MPADAIDLAYKAPSTRTCLGGERELGMPPREYSGSIDFNEGGTANTVQVDAWGWPGPSKSRKTTMLQMDFAGVTYNRWIDAYYKPRAVVRVARQFRNDVIEGRVRPMSWSEVRRRKAKNANAGA